jgi:hypothetical protein
LNAADRLQAVENGESHETPRCCPIVGFPHFWLVMLRRGKKMKVRKQQKWVKRLQQDLKALGIDRSVRFKMINFAVGCDKGNIILDQMNEEYSVNNFLKYVTMNMQPSK